MQWNVVAKNQVLLSLRVDPEFLDWLRPRVADSDVAQFDAYRDSSLDIVAQERWLAALKRAYEALRAEVGVSVQRTYRLPSDPQIRESIIHNLVERELSQHPWKGLLCDLVAALELSRESHGLISAFGD
jgi:hypothetical protein